MTARRLAVLLALLAATLSPAPAAARPGTPEEEAVVHYEKGLGHVQAGELDQAIAEFEQAHALSGRAELLFNIGQVYRKKKAYAQARARFEQYLRELPGAPNRADVETLIAEMKRLEAAEAGGGTGTGAGAGAGAGTGTGTGTGAGTGAAAGAGAGAGTGPATGVAAQATRAPRPARIVAGALLGAHLFSDDVELGVHDIARVQAPKSFALLGARVAAPVWRSLQVEGELVLIPTSDRPGNRITVLGWRAHARWQLAPLAQVARLAPFVLAGGGGLTAFAGGNEYDTVASDTDLSAHWGAGVERQIGRLIVRVEARHVLLPDTTLNGFTSDFELQAGVGLGFGGR